MDPSLKKLIFFRYKPVIILLAVGIIGIYFFQTVTGITSWKSNNHYFSTEKAQKDFKEEIANSYEFSDEEAGKLFLYYDLMKEQVVYTNDFEEYKQYNLTFFNAKYDGNQLPLNSYTYYDENFAIMLIIFVTTGVLLFLFDLKAQFTAALVSSKFKRSDIYWTKYYFIGGTLSLSLLVSKLVSFISYQLLIPNEYLNISLKQHIFSTLSGGLILISLFLISSLVGLFFGEWLYGIAAIVILFFTFPTFLNSIDFLAASFVDKNSDNMPVSFYSNFEKVLPTLQTSTQKNQFIPLIIIVFLGVVSLVVGQKVFKSISLENIGNFILVPKYNRIFQAVFIFYFLFTISGNDIFSLIFPYDSVLINNMIFSFFKICFTFIALIIVTEYLLYKNQSKLIQKINFFK